MKCQILFSWKNINLLSAELVQTAVKVKQPFAFTVAGLLLFQKIDWTMRNLLTLRRQSDCMHTGLIQVFTVYIYERLPCFWQIQQKKN